MLVHEGGASNRRTRSSTSGLVADLKRSGEADTDNFEVKVFTVFMALSRETLRALCVSVRRLLVSVLALCVDRVTLAFALRAVSGIASSRARRKI